MVSGDKHCDYLRESVFEWSSFYLGIGFMPNINA